MQNKKTYITLLLIAVTGLILFFLLNKKNKSQPLYQDTALDIAFNKHGELFFVNENSSDTLAIIDIEVADNDALRARGLMYRKSMLINEGMLFIHDYEQIQSFWMKNTYIPLDMIFVDSNHEIITIHQNTTPLSERSYSSTLPALYVVEVNAGFCNSNNIKTGDKIQYILTK